MPALTKIPAWLQVFNKDICWSIPQAEKAIYLTFDDGPHPVATPIILNILNQFNCKASFFCVGKQVAKEPEIYQRILMEGHTVGNHSYSHLNGWNMKAEDFLGDVEKASDTIHSKLFRPPYGRITPLQFKMLKGKYKVIMWDVLSKDYENEISDHQVIDNVMKNIVPGSIVVMHDNDKTANRIGKVLPLLLTLLKEDDWLLKKL